MARDHGKSIGDEEQYDAVRDGGMSDEEAARVTNVPGAAEADAYEEWTTAELYERAQEVGIDGRSSMSKTELISALRSG